MAMQIPKLQAGRRRSFDARPALSKLQGDDLLQPMEADFRFTIGTNRSFGTERYGYLKNLLRKNTSRNTTHLVGTEDIPLPPPITAALSTEFARSLEKSV